MSTPAVVGDKETTPASVRRIESAPMQRLGTFRRWYWLAVPVLAILAYATVLRIGFLADDLGLYFVARYGGLDWQDLLPEPHLFYYRPLGSLLVWHLGAYLWGDNPLPYHAVGLLLHAAVSLMLGLWLAEATKASVECGVRSAEAAQGPAEYSPLLKTASALRTPHSALGWLAGALFAVFPLHLEAVGWAAAQWDEWAALFVLVSLYFFTKWWRAGRGWRLYALAFLFYFLGLFAKDSLLAFLPVYVLVAWFVRPPDQVQGPKSKVQSPKSEVRHRSARGGVGPWTLDLGLCLLPFCAVLGLNVALRFIAWGRVGGYRGTSTDIAGIVWGGTGSFGRMLLSPINTTIFGAGVGWAVGALSGVALLLGLVFHGRKVRSLLILAGGWIFFSLVPVLNVAIYPDSLRENRLLYLAVAGYCIGVAALGHSALSSRFKVQGSRDRSGISSIPPVGMLGILLVGVLLLLSIATCWVQLGVWHTASVQVVEQEQELQRLIPTPPEQRPNGLVWLVDNLPDYYRGVFVLSSGLGRTRLPPRTNYIDLPGVIRVDSATQADLASNTHDVFALHFTYDKGSERFHTEYAAGIIIGDKLPSPAEMGDNFTLWGFTGCSPDVVDRWQISQSQARCEVGKGLMVDAGTQMVGPTFNITPIATGTRFVRLRVAAIYPPRTGTEPLVTKWYWQGEGQDWDEARSKSLPVAVDGNAHVYWTFLPASEVGQIITGLRLDPANPQVPAEVRWIAVDMVK